MKFIKKVFSYIKKAFYLLLKRQRRFRKRFGIRVDFNRILRKNPHLKKIRVTDKKYLNDSIAYIQEYFPGYKDMRWHSLYSGINGIKANNYIPEELFLGFIEPALNDKSIKFAYTDKTFYDVLFEKTFLPETILKLINGSFYTADNIYVTEKKAFEIILQISGNIALKPAMRSGGGKNIIIAKAAEVLKNLKNNSMYQHDSFIIQKGIIQHELLKQFHPTSVNSLRIMTARMENEILLLCCYFRTGSKKSVIDNGVAGGIMCGFNEDGKLHKVGYDILFKPHFEHPDTGKPFENFKIPGAEEAIKFCKSNHKSFPHFTIISWDIAIDQNSKPVFIEFNVSSLGVNIPQIINGPIFGEHTDYFLKKYKDSKLNDLLKFSI